VSLFPAPGSWPTVASLPSSSDPPPLLRMFHPGNYTSGALVTTPQQWAARSAELRSLLQHYLYGYLPLPQAVSAEVVVGPKIVHGGLGWLKVVRLAFGPSGAPPVDLLIVGPRGVTGPVPCLLRLNEGGNHTTTLDPDVPIPSGWWGPIWGGTPARGASIGWESWPYADAIARGYAIATLFTSDLHPDSDSNSVNRSLTDGGQHPHYQSPPGSAPTNDSWRTLAAWAYGLRQAVSYLRTDRLIQRSGIGVVGHSRTGKAALLAGALDERIALTVSVQSGQGGTAPMRVTATPPPETMAALNTSFPHWMSERAKLFTANSNQHLLRLPVDAHVLHALCAPRPVLSLQATNDTWANPQGSYNMAALASPAYELLGVDGLVSASYPAEGTARYGGRIGFWRRAGDHLMTDAEWTQAMNFADLWLPEAEPWVTPLRAVTIGGTRVPVRISAG
jgi:hypothetical protein